MIGDDRLVRSRSCLVSVALLLAACTSGDDQSGADDQASEDGGEQPEVATFYIETNASSVCSGGGSVELVTRRVDCWDPPLPCTLAQNPPWLSGTTGNCGGATSRFEVTVPQTGRWESRLQTTGAIECLGVGGQARTNVARDDLTNRVEFLLAPAPAGQCGEL